MRQTYPATLYSSNTNPSRDNPGNAVKFTVPTVANGKVYVGAQYQLSVYGLLSGQETATDPVFSPGTESFSGSLAVSMTDATQGATIYYTLDGSTPTVASAVYTAPLTISATTTTSSDCERSRLPAERSNFRKLYRLLASKYAGLQSRQQHLHAIHFSDHRRCHRRCDRSTTQPTGRRRRPASTQYTVSDDCERHRDPERDRCRSRICQTAMWPAQLTQSTPGKQGSTSRWGLQRTQGIMILNGSTDLDDSRLQLTNGLTGEAGSAWYYQPVNIQAFTSEFSFQLSNPAGEGITFAIQGNNNTSLGAAGSGLGYQGIANSIAVKFDLINTAGEGPDSTGLYTDGASPTVPAIDLSTTGIDSAQRRYLRRDNDL